MLAIGADRRPACRFLGPFPVLRLPLHPAIAAPIAAALVLTPSKVLARAPTPVVGMNNHAGASWEVPVLGGMPTYATAADSCCDKARTPTPMIAPNNLLLDVISGTSALGRGCKTVHGEQGFPEQKFLIRRALITMNNRSDTSLRSDREHMHGLCASKLGQLVR